MALEAVAVLVFYRTKVLRPSDVEAAGASQQATMVEAEPSEKRSGEASTKQREALGTSVAPTPSVPLSRADTIAEKQDGGDGGEKKE